MSFVLFGNYYSYKHIQCNILKEYIKWCIIYYNIFKNICNILNENNFNNI